MTGQRKNKKIKNSIQVEPNKPSSRGTETAPAIHDAKTPKEVESISFGLRTKYYSIVPLHIILINFTIYFLPVKVLQRQNTISTDQKDAQDSIFNQFITLLVHRPILSLSIINLGALIVQIWFITFLNSWKKSLQSSSSSTFPTKKRISPTAPISQLFKHLITLDYHRLRQVDPSILNFYNQIWLVIKESVITNVIITIGINVIIVLLGGSIKAIDRNLFLSSLITILSFFPASVIITWNQGRQKPNWIRIFSSFKPRNELEVALLCPVFGTCFGTWLGAIPIPLDWDRPWQIWPITCVIGASIGHSIGSLASVFWCSRFTPE